MTLLILCVPVPSAMEQRAWNAEINLACTLVIGENALANDVRRRVVSITALCFSSLVGTQRLVGRRPPHDADVQEFADKPASSRVQDR